MTPLLRAVSLSALLSASTSAWAQYKVVDAQGHVTYSDTPPPAAAATRVTRLRAGSATDDVAAAPLPLALRTVAERYPVVLYTATADCAGCDRGRAQLQRRGIPFDERRVDTPDDAAALERLTGTTDLPLLRIGKQTLHGHAPDAWDTYLSAAGYPAQSMLPAGYHAPPPQPVLHRPARAPTGAVAPDPAPVEQVPAAPAVAPQRAPGGIAF